MEEEERRRRVDFLKTVIPSTRAKIAVLSQSYQVGSDVNLMCLNIGTPKTINFPFRTNGKLTAFDVPILKHNKVCFSRKNCTRLAVKVYIISFPEW